MSGDRISNCLNMTNLTTTTVNQAAESMRTAVSVDLCVKIYIGVYILT